MNAGTEPQPAKIGPDFIDPGHHRAVTDKPSRTLDLWLEGEEGLARNYSRGEGEVCVAEAGLPIFGEGGGMMAMSRDLTTTDGETYGMAGILPAEVEMVDGLQGLGYVEVKARDENSNFPSGESYRGHEFHYSRTRVDSGAEFVFDNVRGSGIDGEHDGVRRYNAVGTYGHFHPESGLFDDFL